MGKETGDNLNITFTTRDERVSELLTLLREITDLRAMSGLATWDRHTTSASGSSAVRGEQLATLEGLIFERQTAPRMRDLLQELGDLVEQDHFTDADRGLVFRARHSYERRAKLPRAFVEELTRVRVSSSEAWVKARQQNDFASFAPWLQRIVQLQREQADYIGFRESRYDTLLEETNPGLTVSQLETLFTPIRDASITLLRRIQASGKEPDTSCLYGSFSPEQQRLLCQEMAESIGYDFNHGLISQSAHPFTATNLGSPLDVRFTVNYDEHYVGKALMAGLHETGHALYEQGVSLALLRTPLAHGTSSGVHESQSRLWENGLGRSEPFWQKKYAILQKHFPQPFKSVDVTTFVRALNRVRPSLIRIEADEVTYNLHILIRFELEQALLNGEIAIESLPTQWNAKYREYLGIEPENDSVGVLQDMHWSAGLGNFPSYTLGNIYAAQILQHIRSLFADFDARLSSGDTTFILQWLREHMHSSGSTYLPNELITRMTGEAPQTHYLVQYLTDKFERLYDLQPV